MRRHRGGLTAHHNRAEPQYSRPGAPIHPEQPRGTKATTTRLTIAGNRKFESTSLQRRVQCEPDADDFLAAGGAVLAEPLADRAHHEMPAQPVLCWLVVIRRFLSPRNFFDRFV